MRAREAGGGNPAACRSTGSTCWRRLGGAAAFVLAATLELGRLGDRRTCRLRPVGAAAGARRRATGSTPTTAPRFNNCVEGAYGMARAAPSERDQAPPVSSIAPAPMRFDPVARPRPSHQRSPATEIVKRKLPPPAGHSVDSPRAAPGRPHAKGSKSTIRQPEMSERADAGAHHLFHSRQLYY